MVGTHRPRAIDITSQAESQTNSPALRPGKIGDEGNRTIPVSASKTPISEPRGTESGTVDAPNAPIDTDLAFIQDRWPDLPEHIKAAITTLVQAHGKGRK